ncbi:hypothetical protein FE773_05010 [Caminibacter mediatlanticus TB-2]|uniref:Uncharacterized protein n=1 Tax=Caminibacter mediatlanticus TB-2 TaxID=391592 RepID=A0ABX5VAU6_9BACT|nr:hypothetical protein [Caminibacter mediatlanticus]QCT94557.1 hypothetical protein FE773_05010 [Caminibacter mediatlanticus TB-2]
MTITNYYPPITFLPTYYTTTPITFDSTYIQNLEALGVLDNYSPLLFTRNPLFTQVNEFNQNIGILQTAYKSLENIYTLIDTLKEINNPTKEIIQSFENEINDIINNTTFNDIDVFNQKITINNQTIDLNLPKFSYENLDNFEKSILEKEELIKSVLESNLSPFNENYNFTPINFETFNTILNSPISNAFKLELINPDIVNLLLS